MAFQAGGPHAQDRGLEAVAPRLRRDAPRTPRGDLGEAAGQAPAAADDASVHGSSRAASRWSSAATRSRRGTPTRACSPASRPATRCSSSRSRRAVLPLAITVAIAREVLAEAGFSPDLVALAVERRATGSAADARAAPRGPDRSTSPARARSATWLEAHATQAVVFTEKAGREQRRHRLDRRLPGHAAQPRVLAVAVQRADVHDPAEPAGARRRHRHRRRATGRSTRSRRTSPARSTGCSATRSGRPRSSARSSATTSWRGSPRRAASATSCWRRRRSSIPSSPTRGPHTPLLVALPASSERDYGAGVLRAGQLPRPTAGTDESLEILRRTTREHGAHDGGVYYTTDPGVIDAGRGGRDRRRRVAVDQPDRRRLRQPVGGVLRLPRDGREPGRERRRSPTRPS